MSKRDGYLYYQAGQAVAAVYLGLTIRRITVDPGLEATEILFPRHDPKPRMIAWLTGMAAEKKGVGRSDPLRRTRNRIRMRAMVEAVQADMAGASAKRRAASRNLLNQAQDRAHAIGTNLAPAIEKVARELLENHSLTGAQVQEIVNTVRAQPVMKRHPKA